MTIKAFVTGGTGFIGAHLVRLLLNKGYQVKVLVRRESKLDNLQGLPVEIVTGELNSPDLPSLMQDCQVLFHVAAHYSLWRTERSRLYQYNVLGTRNVLAAARESKIDRVVYTSSVAAIGVGKDGQPVDETYQSPVEKLIGDYKKSKYFAEQEAYNAIKLGQDIVIVNPSTPVGALDLKPTPTGDIILRFLRGQMPAYVNTGLNIVDVKDVARGHLLALEKGVNGDRYILGNQNLTLKELLATLAQITGLKPPTVTIPLWIPLTVATIDEFILAPLGKTPSIPLDGVKMSAQLMYYNCQKAREVLGLPQSPITNALTEAVNWFKEQGYC
ncbi:MAG: NAD-dependent epimerase/dehydratase family protein [Gloeocapsa sp. DLM2.Bin57]|nr:MAG: NAD-dependent epimerase/dehydratase family protein [Gloeocapsa sp. DLM2.Bin57]